MIRRPHTFGLKVYVFYVFVTNRLPVWRFKIGCNLLQLYQNSDALILSFFPDKPNHIAKYYEKTKKKKKENILNLFGDLLKCSSVWQELLKKTTMPQPNFLFWFPLQEQGPTSWYSIGPPCNTSVYLFLILYFVQFLHSNIFGV